ncbi:ABC transporter ATP-binding protein [Pseudosporangium ferrugineum]|uniref:Carbohydrate ABC transporter ATP-binding protein (CUT1 family) n=1 Tax=Pseudosporangium ferrugineum TaxID=439699 RepID=A0A2T0SIH0_9ACTN|nr:ABC transporter ATP-binding protein [Pseudosporangium ferrugineum]PRY33211.1 carbohydrate ABC transporter ATP-binding protein (CUT1 family) [Pseudosporangium ferrugineum]
MAGVTVSNLVKTYPSGSRRATDDVSLEVADGEFLVLVGPSGCGKTTLLRMVAGLETPDGGTVSIGGRDVTALPARDRRLSMVFQSYAIFPHLRVRENIGFGLTMRKVPKPEWESRVRRAAALLDLEDLLDRYPAQLSGGQRQRVAVARAIVVDADVLLMDEPLSNLDALLRMQFRAELKKIVARLGTTTLYVTHDQAEAMSLGDRVAVLRDGRIAQLGPPMDVYDRPAERFVGGFLGAPPMNFFLATVHDGRLVVDEQRSLPAPAVLGAWQDRKILVGVRAERLGVGVPDGLTAEVEVAEPTGAAVLLTVRWPAGELKVQAGPGFRAAPGDRITLTFPPGALRFFDPDTSLALPLG